MEAEIEIEAIFNAIQVGRSEVDKTTLRRQKDFGGQARRIGSVHRKVKDPFHISRKPEFSSALVNQAGDK